MRYPYVAPRACESAFASLRRSYAHIFMTVQPIFRPRCNTRRAVVFLSRPFFFFFFFFLYARAQHADRRVTRICCGATPQFPIREDAATGAYRRTDAHRREELPLAIMAARRRPVFTALALPAWSAVSRSACRVETLLIARRARAELAGG